MHRNLIYGEGGTTNQRDRKDYRMVGIGTLEKNKTGSLATMTYQGEIQVD